MAGEREIVIGGGHQPMPQEIAKNKTAYVEEEISKGKPVAALEYENGIIVVTENPRSAVLGKIFEIYDCIALAAVGHYSEYERLKKDAVGWALINGIEYSRRDVKAGDLADRLSETLSAVFNDFRFMPMRVEFLVLEVGEKAEDNLFLRVRHNGAIALHSGVAIIGGRTEEVKKMISSGTFRFNLPLAEALKEAKKILEFAAGTGILEKNLEVAVLDRTLPGERKFRKLSAEEIQRLLN